MTINPRSRQLWLICLGLGLSLPLLTGQGCPGVPGAPQVEVSAPSIPMQVSIGDSVIVMYDVRVANGGAVTVSAFYDRDGTFDSGDEVFFATDLPTGKGHAELDTTGLPPGLIRLGIVASNPAGTTARYASGTVTLVDPSATPSPNGSLGNPGLTGGTGTDPLDPGFDDGLPGDPGVDAPFLASQLLTMRTPGAEITIVQGSTFTIRWTSRLRLGEGTIELFLEPDRDRDGRPDGAPSRIIISPEGYDVGTLNFRLDTTPYRGTFFIGGTVTPADPELEPVTTLAPGPLNIIPPIFWVGNLVTQFDFDGTPLPQTGPMQGAVFRGHNIGDNLGSAMMATDDYDGDGFTEILLAAQFGKPGLQAQGGRGAGEAYLIYGGPQRYIGSFEVNQTGQPQLPGVIFSGIVPNPNPTNHARGNQLMEIVEGDFLPGPFSSEGLRSLTAIPDQDDDGVEELVFGFPFVDSYSLRNQVLDGSHPAPLQALGRLENNGHFMRGGVVIVSSTNSLLANRNAFSRHGDRVMMLHEVGQAFETMVQRYAPRTDGDFGGVPITLDICPLNECPGVNQGTPEIFLPDVAFWPGEGFTQNTLRQTSFPISSVGAHGGFSGELGSVAGIDPPRLATPPIPIDSANNPGVRLQVARGELIQTDQIDPLPPLTSPSSVAGRLFSGCVSEFLDNEGEPGPPFGLFPSLGNMRVLGTGFYYASGSLPNLGLPSCPPLLGQYLDYCPANRISSALEPIGARVLGQMGTRSPTDPANRRLLPDRFGHSVSVSGDFLMVGAPDRTAKKAEVTAMRTNPLLGDRENSGEVYMLQLRRTTLPRQFSLWDSQDDDSAPAPHNYIIQSVGYTRCIGNLDTSLFLQPGNVGFEMSRPFHIVGAAEGDHIGEVTSLGDINNDGVDDFAVGGPQTNGDRGAVYVIYRRQPQIEADYLLERLQLAPNDLNRLNGLFIIGRPGERLGTALDGGDFNGDGRADLVIGSPRAASAAGFQSGEVFILFGGQNLLSPQGGITIPELRDAGHGMVLAGAHPGDMAGTTVANAGDVNGNGIDDLLIAAPNASPRFDSTGDGVLDAIGIDLNGDGVADDLNGDGSPDDLTQAGLVYLVFGGEHLTGTINLREIGTENLPGMVFVGREAGDRLGGGLTQNGLLSRGIASAGDIDGDGRTDFFLSSVLASPEGKTNAGEVYLIYGFPFAITEQ